MSVPISLANALIPTQAFDMVGVYDQNFVQVFPNARPTKISIKPEAKLMEHPIESGATTIDHIVKLPIEIEISLILKPSDYKNTYNKIKQLYLNATLLTVQSKVDIYTNQIISSPPHEEDPAYFDTITIALKLKQVLFATAQYQVIARNPANNSTVDRGNQQGEQATTDSSVFRRLIG